MRCSVLAPLAPVVTPVSSIEPSRRPPSSRSTVPSLPIQVWCHRPEVASNALRLVPVEPPAPVHSSRRPHPALIEWIRFVPAGRPFGSVTFHSPSQKSNCRCSARVHAGGDCAATGPSATQITSAIVTDADDAGFIDPPSLRQSEAAFLLPRIPL